MIPSVFDWGGPGAAPKDYGAHIKSKKRRPLTKRRSKRNRKGFISLVKKEHGFVNRKTGAVLS